MIVWPVTAQFYRHINLASVRIPLHSFLDNFKIVSSNIENDTLVLGFAHDSHFLTKGLIVYKPQPLAIYKPKL